MKKYTDEELINILKGYYQNIGFPTQRKFNNKNNLPSYVTYFNRFGSFRNAILIAEIKIPEERRRFFNRDELSSEEMLRLLKYYTEKKLKTDIFLLTNEDIDENPNIPSSSTYLTRFGGIIEAYKLIGYDYYRFNNNQMKKNMIKKLKELATILKRTPNSRDINKYSQNGFGYCMGAYEFHFGSLYEAQIACGLEPTIVGRNKAREELLDDLKILYKKFNRIPTHQDINMEEGMASASKYAHEFGSLLNALKTIGIDEKELNTRGYFTENGVVCYSIYEHKFASMLESENITFKTEPLYKDYIENFGERYRFDFEVTYNNKKYLVEIFGITTNEDYDKRRKEKIKICKNNNIPLISLYPNIFWSTTQEELFFYFKEKMRKIDEVFYS